THSGLECVRLHFPSCRSRGPHYDRISVSSPRPLFWSSFVPAGLLAFEADPWNSFVVLSTTSHCLALRQACLPSQRVLHPEKASHLEARRRFSLRSLPRQSPHDQQ